MIIIYLYCGNCGIDLGTAVIYELKGKDMRAETVCDECRLLLEPDLGKEN